MKIPEWADTRCSSSGESIEQTKLRPTRSSEPSGGSRGIGEQGENGQRQKWPARPGEDQHDWEAPRTIWKAERRLGRSVNGPRDRIDRIRLLGNGVVPQTAAKAYFVLDQEMKSSAEGAAE